MDCTCGIANLAISGFSGCSLSTTGLRSEPMFQVVDAIVVQEQSLLFDALLIIRLLCFIALSALLLLVVFYLLCV